MFFYYIGIVLVRSFFNFNFNPLAWAIASLGQKALTSYKYQVQALIIPATHLSLGWPRAHVATVAHNYNHNPADTILFSLTILNYSTQRIK